MNREEFEKDMELYKSNYGPNPPTFYNGYDAGVKVAFDWCNEILRKRYRKRTARQADAFNAYLEKVGAFEDDNHEHG